MAVLVRVNGTKEKEVHAAIRTSGNISHLQHFNLRYVIPDYTDQESLCRLLEEAAPKAAIPANMTTLPRIVLRPTAVYGTLEKALFVLFKVMRALTSPSIQTGYNISDGHSYSRYALADIFRRIFGVRMLRIHVPLPCIDKLLEVSAPGWNCNIQQSGGALVTIPAYNLEKDMKETLECTPTINGFRLN